ncbi:MAG: DUF3857 domain-containing protein [Candidatus Glassbacteria bacterium]|nr:DUF3857 domain-containing protein [Candidatus Glassbacteria bacterium]
MNKLLSLPLLLAAFLLADILAPSPGLAAQAGPELVEKLIAATAEKYPDANSVIVEADRTISYNEDGTYLHREHVLIKLLTETGKKRWGEQGHDYSRKYNTLRIETARVIKPDGRVVDVPEEMIKDVTHPMLARMNIFDSEVRIQLVTFPSLEVGDAIEYEVVDSCFNAPMAGQFDWMDLFQIGEPIVNKRIEITGPASLPLHYVVKDGEAEFSLTTENGLNTYVWEVRDVPRIVAEPAMPPYYSFAPRLIVSTIDDWRQVSRWWYEMTSQFRTADDSLSAVVSRITEGLATDEEKIKAIYHFVAQKVRYMGLGTGKKAGFEPKPASETLSTRYGVCRDVAVLMSTMLDEVDIESYVVLTRAGELIDEEIPIIGFNHAIVALPEAEGGWRFSDPTVENNPDLLMAAEAGAHMLVCTPAGEPLVTSDHMPAEDNMGTISATSRVESDGRLVSEVTISTAGIYDLAFRGFIKRFPPRQMQSIWQQIVSGVHPGARLIGFSSSDPEDLYSAFGIKFSYEVPDYAIAAGDYLLIKSPVSTNSFELILESFLSAAGLPEREYPFNLGMTLGSTQREELALPPGYRIKSMPETVDLADGDLTYRMAYRADMPSETNPLLTVRYDKQFLIDSKQLSTDEYLQLKEILRASSRSGRGEIILEADSDGGPR